MSQTLHGVVIPRSDKVFAPNTPRNYVLGEAGTNIPANSDLNNYTTPGVFFSASASNSQTLQNSPTGAGFTMQVFKLATGGVTKQIIYTNQNSNIGYERKGNNGAWSDWQQNYNTSILTDSTVLSSLASALGASVTYLGVSDDLFNLPKVGWYTWTGSGSAPQNNAAPQASGVLYQVFGNVNCLIQFTNFGGIYYTYRWNYEGGTWQSWKQVSLVTPTT